MQRLSPGIFVLLFGAEHLGLSLKFQSEVGTLCISLCLVFQKCLLVKCWYLAAYINLSQGTTKGSSTSRRYSIMNVPILLWCMPMQGAPSPVGGLESCGKQT